MSSGLAPSATEAEAEAGAAESLPRGARDVVVIADHDKAGIAHAQTVAHSLELAGIPHRELVPPTAGHDVSDHLGDFGELDELVPLDELEQTDERPTGEVWFESAARRSTSAGTAPQERQWPRLERTYIGGGAFRPGSSVEA